MLPKVFNSLLLVAAFLSATVVASPERIFARKACGPHGCSTNGGSAHCMDIGCDGNCVENDYCTGATECNTHFSNCARDAVTKRGMADFIRARGSVEYTIAKRAGKLVDSGNGNVEVADDAHEYVQGILDQMKKGDL